MAGLYIHIPFCTKRCLYCDFYSNTDMRYKEDFSRALICEIEQRKDYLVGESIDTIYFGGGTPSQLPVETYQHYFEVINGFFDLSSCREITLEANPDDLTAAYIHSLRSLPFNRISMGVQSFADDDLLFLNRRHNAVAAIDAVRRSQEAGFTNLSIDLIYGLPNQTLEAWEKNLEVALSLDVPHISAYHLIYEEGTALYRLWQAGKVNQADEDLSMDLFLCLISRLKEAGYEHYEISNFAKQGMYAQHNTSYWNGTNYLGLGPSAHSFNGHSRQWNVSSIHDYIHGMLTNQPLIEIEHLSKKMQYDEYIITRLRTMWGISLAYVETYFGLDYKEHLLRQAQSALHEGTLMQEKDILKLSERGIFISDGLMTDLLSD